MNDLMMSICKAAAAAGLLCAVVVGFVYLFG
jgi:hypothetical protein